MELTELEKSLGIVDEPRKIQPTPTPLPTPKKSFFKDTFVGKTLKGAGDVAVGFAKGAGDTLLSVPRNVQKVVVEGSKLSVEKQNNKIRESINAQNEELLKVMKSLPQGDPRREKYKKLIQQNMEQFQELGKSEDEVLKQIDQDASWIPADKGGIYRDAINDGFAAKNKAQQFGFRAEKIGELIVPAGATAKAGKAIDTVRVLPGATRGARIVNATARTVAKGGVEAGTAAAATLGQAAYQGRLDTEEGREGVKKEMKQNALFAGGAKILMSGGGEVIKGVKNLLPKTTNQESIRKISGEILQGPKELQDTAAKVLTKLDTSKVKNYDDLVTVVKNKIAENSKNVDDVLSVNTEKIPIQSLQKVDKVGKTIVSSNPVDDALSHLEEYYDSSKDYVNAERIRQIKETGTLTAKEVNDLAREYSREFSKKAFNKMGDPLTSVNARAMENTRSSLKGVSRNIINDDSVKAIDKETSELYSLVPYFEKTSARANDIQQRLTDRGIMEKVGNAVGKGIDWTTGGFARSLVTSFFPRGQGIKLSNATEIQKALSGNLKTLNRLSSMIDDGASDTAIIEFIKKNIPNSAKTLYKNGTMGVSTRRIIPELIRDNSRNQNEIDGIIDDYQ